MKVEIYDPAKLVSANEINTFWKAKNVSALLSRIFHKLALIKPADFMCWKLSNAQLFAVRQLRQMAYAVPGGQEQHQQGGSILMFGK
jgi:hypothetical protein